MTCTLIGINRRRTSSQGRWREKFTGDWSADWMALNTSTLSVPFPQKLTRMAACQSPNLRDKVSANLSSLGTAFLLSAAIGLEREIRHKSAGLRTYTVVGTAAALFLLISKYGFTDVLVADRIVLDPSRVAAQIVTGIKLIGAGLIFVRDDRVAGLTTAATVWLVTGIGMACGAGLPLLAVAATVAYFIVALVFPLILGILPGNIPAEQNGNPRHD